MYGYIIPNTNTHLYANGRYFLQSNILNDMHKNKRPTITIHILYSTQKRA